MDELLKLRSALNAKIKATDAKIDAFLAIAQPTPEQVADAEKLDAEAKDLYAEREKIDARITKKQAEMADDERQRQLEADESQRRIQAERTRRAGANRITDTSAGSIRVVQPETVPAEPRDPRMVRSFGYQNFGQFAMDVRTANTSRRTPERYLNGFHEAQQAAATGMGEAVGSDGGFLVPPEFASRIFERVYAADSLLARTDIYTIARNSITFPRIDETSRATGSRAGGVQAYFADEADSVTATKPKIGRFTLNLHKLMAFGRATDELIEDSETALEQFLFRQFSEEITFLVNNSLVNGTGAGQPVGILNADCTVSVTKETGQSAATINATNILKMWSRMWARSRTNAIWLINQDVEPQLYSMQIGTGVSNQVVYMPPGGLSSAPYATLMGRPVIPVEFCSTLGTVGDIILVDLSQWVTAVKGGGPMSAVSMHLYFDTDEMAYRTTWRFDSQPWWNSPLTPFKGSNTQSPAVTLATRA